MATPSAPSSDRRGLFSSLLRPRRASVSSTADAPVRAASLQVHRAVARPADRPPASLGRASRLRPSEPVQRPLSTITASTSGSASASPVRTVLPPEAVARPATPSRRRKTMFGLLSSPRKPSSPRSPTPPSHVPEIALSYRAQSPVMSVETQSPSATTSSKLHIFRASRIFSSSSTKNHPPNIPVSISTDFDPPASRVDAPTGTRHRPESSQQSRHQRQPSQQSHHSSTSSFKIHSPKPQRQVPQITHTPPTPQRPSSTPPRLNHHRKDSNASQHRALRPVTEERHSKPSASENGHNRHPDKGKAKDPQMTNHAKAATTSNISKERKHGSFNFERPSWTSSSVGARPRHLFDDYPLTRVASAGAAIPAPSRQSPYPSSHRLVPPPPEPPTIPDCHTTTVSASSSQQSHSQTHSHSTHKTTSSAGGAKPRTSSWGKMMGKRTKKSTPPPPPPVHLKSAGMTHGQFSFEPAVPSPTGDREFTQKRDHESRRPVVVREQESRKRYVVPEQPPSERPVGYRSGTKGRSLDLGLGLSWAPRKVREDALLPTFQASRSLSGSGSSRDHHARDVIYVNEHGVTQQRASSDVHADGNNNSSKVGRDVAEVFKKALDDRGYIQFKRYVHQFDAHEIPVDGSTGIVAQVERLLDRAPCLSSDGKRDLLNSFVRIILQNA